jgi:hypothetical protein
MKICLVQQPSEAWVAQDHISACWVNAVEGNEIEKIGDVVKAASISEHSGEGV